MIRWMNSEEYAPTDQGRHPKTPGHYRVKIVYRNEWRDNWPQEYYEWMEIVIDSADSHESLLYFDFPHGEEVSMVVAWYGPIIIPEFK